MNLKFIKIRKSENIKSEDISVVVQGAIDSKYTNKALKSIRKFLPKAEIILSTWENSHVEGLDYDILQLNTDPGAEVFTPEGKKQNQNRQILSTKNGINLASKQYVLKLRSDIELKGIKFLSYFGKYNKRNNKCKILKERILINSLYTRNSLYPKHINGKHFLQPYLFHVSDWVMFGLKEDMLNIWDIPLAPEPFTSQYFKNHPELPHDNGCLTRWHAEQYIWIQFLRKNGIKLDYDNYWVYNDDFKALSELSIVNNTTLLEYKKEFDILNLKYPNRYGDSDTMHPLDFLILYKKYCDPSYKIPMYYRWQDELGIRQYIIHINKHYNKFKLPIKRFFRWLSEPISIISYSIKILGNSLLRIHRLFK